MKLDIQNILVLGLFKILIYKLSLDKKKIILTHEHFDSPIMEQYFNNLYRII